MEIHKDFIPQLINKSAEVFLAFLTFFLVISCQYLSIRGFSAVGQFLMLPLYYFRDDKTCFKHVKIEKVTNNW